MSRERRYLEDGDFLLIAEAVTGILANVLAESDRIVSQADSALHVPQSGFGAIADVLVAVAAHTMSERDFIAWVTGRMRED